MLKKLQNMFKHTLNIYNIRLLTCIHLAMFKHVLNMSVQFFDFSKKKVVDDAQGSAPIEGQRDHTGEGVTKARKVGAAARPPRRRAQGPRPRSPLPW